MLQLASEDAVQAPIVATFGNIPPKEFDYKLLLLIASLGRVVAKGGITALFGKIPPKKFIIGPRKKNWCVMLPFLLIVTVTFIGKPFGWPSKPKVYVPGA